LKKPIFVIYATSYDENSGGCIALHKLCHILNSIGYPAFLFPEIMSNTQFSTLGREMSYSSFDDLVSRNFKSNSSFQCPILSAASLTEIKFSNNVVTVYPEVTDGNPLDAKNIVRWLLHDLGFHTGRININRGDFIVPYGLDNKKLLISGCQVSNSFLRVHHIPFEKYNIEGESSNRSGTAYCIRKGKGRKMVHPENNAILIDGKSHGEISEIFRRVERFYSYDTKTTYSMLAVLCGCESIVVPDEGVTLEEWCSDPKFRIGIHYGVTGCKPSLETINQLKVELQNDEKCNIERARLVVSEILDYFRLTDC
jgi:hypothetical protein